MKKKKTKIGYINSKSPLKFRSKVGSGDLPQLKKQFGNLDVSNLMEGVTNPYANIQTRFENVYEDLTVDQERFKAERETFARSQADTLAKMQEMGMVNVQALQQQGTIASQQVTERIGQQEAANRALKAQGAEKVQAMEKEAELQIQQGKWTAEQAVRQGAMDARNLEYQKVQGLMALEAGELQSKRQAESANRNWFQRTFSDRRLKKNIVLIGRSPSGINIYNFEYKNSSFGYGIYQGVMSDDIPQEAIIKNETGYDMVDYSKLDVDFIKI